jgi:hypothetical protein
MYTIRSLANPAVIHIRVVDTLTTSESLRAISQLAMLAHTVAGSPVIADLRELAVGPADHALVAAALAGACEPGHRIGIVASLPQQRRLERILTAAGVRHLVCLFENPATAMQWAEALVTPLPSLSETELRHLRELAKLEAKPQRAAESRGVGISAA